MISLVIKIINVTISNISLILLIDIVQILVAGGNKRTTVIQRILLANSEQPLGNIRDTYASARDVTGYEDHGSHPFFRLRNIPPDAVMMNKSNTTLLSHVPTFFLNHLSSCSANNATVETPPGWNSEAKELSTTWAEVAAGDDGIQLVTRHTYSYPTTKEGQLTHRDLVLHNRTVLSRVVRDRVLQYGRRKGSNLYDQIDIYRKEILSKAELAEWDHDDCVDALLAPINRVMLPQSHENKCDWSKSIYVHGTEKTKQAIKGSGIPIGVGAEKKIYVDYLILLQTALYVAPVHPDAIEVMRTAVTTDTMTPLVLWRMFRTADVVSNLLSNSNALGNIYEPRELHKWVSCKGKYKHLAFSCALYAQLKFFVANMNNNEKQMPSQKCQATSFAARCFVMATGERVETGAFAITDREIEEEIVGTLSDDGNYETAKPGELFTKGIYHWWLNTYPVGLKDLVARTRGNILTAENTILANPDLFDKDGRINAGCAFHYQNHLDHGFVPRERQVDKWFDDVVTRDDFPDDSAIIITNKSYFTANLTFLKPPSE